jgi:quinol monooxygenase YgiN
MLVVVAELKVLPEYWQEFEDEMEHITELVRTEPGCLRYNTTTSIEEPGLFYILEEWESRDHLNTHLETAHMKEHKNVTAGWAAEPVRLSLYETLTIERIEI